MADDKEAAAAHEAAHVIVQLGLGGSVSEARIERQGQWVGSCPRDDSLEPPAIIAVAVAGLVGQLRTREDAGLALAGLDDTDRGYRNDLKAARDAANLIDGVDNDVIEIIEEIVKGARRAEELLQRYAEDFNRFRSQLLDQDRITNPTLSRVS